MSNSEETKKLIPMRLLGSSKLRVFPLCLGTMNFGQNEMFNNVFGIEASFEESEKIVLEYIKHGGNFIDSANFYHNGQSEEWLGKIIKKNNIDRERLVIATKYSLPMNDGSDPNNCGNHKKSMVRSLKESLERLDMDYIDIMYVHVWDHTLDVQDLMRDLDVLVKQGKVLHVAISDTPAWEVSAANTVAKHFGWNPFVCYQGRYALTDRQMENEIIPMSKKNNLGVVPWGIIGGGKLSGKRTRENTNPDGTMRKIQMTEKDFKVQDKVIEIAKKYNVSPSQVATKWVVDQPGITSALIGPRTLEHMVDTMKSLDVKLSEEDIKELNEVSKENVQTIFPHEMIGKDVFSSPVLSFKGKFYQIEEN